MKNLILVGGGGHCKSVIDVAESAGYTILGVLDLPSEVGKKVLDYEVIGVDDDIPNYVDKAEFIITVGQIKDALLREKLHDKIVSAGGRLATIVASTAYVSKYAVLGRGTVVMHKAFVNAEVVIKESCIINTFANIEHSAEIGSFTHISTGAMVNGDCKVGSHVFLGSQSVMLNGTSIGDNNVIAAGSFVRKSIKKSGIYAGNPARLMKAFKSHE